MGVTPTVRFAAISVAAAMMVAGLTGCAQETATPAEPTAPVEEPSAEPTVEPSANADDDVLFIITANVRAADGRTIGVSLKAHTPVASTASSASKLVDKLISVCGAGNGIQPITEEYLRDAGSSLMSIDISANTPDLAFETPIELLFGSPYYAQAASGQGISPIADGVTCFNGFAWAKSGTVEGVADFENPDGQPDLNQWKTGMYGFFVRPSSGATIEACKVKITELGTKQNISETPGWNTSSAGDGVSCKIGYSGE